MKQRNCNTSLPLLRFCSAFVLVFLLSMLVSSSVFAAPKQYNSFSTACPISNGQRVSGTVGSSGTATSGSDIYYRFTVPSTQLVNITCQTSISNSELQIFDSDYAPFCNTIYGNGYFDANDYLRYNATMEAGTYYIRFRAKGTDSMSGDNYEILFTMPNYNPNPVPATPKNLRVTGIDYKTMRLTWSKVNNVSGYHLYISNTANGTYKKCQTIVGNGNTSVTLTDYAPAKTYYFKIQTYKGKQKSAFCAPVSGKTKESYANITSISAPNKKVTLKWNKVSGANSYHILRATGNGNFADIKTVSSKYNTFVDTTAKPGIKYRYAIAVSYKINNKYYLGTRSAAKTITAPK